MKMSNLTIKSCFQADFDFSHGSFLEVFRPKKCSSWFLNVIIQCFVHWFQNCAQLNQSIRANIPVSSLADCQLLESYQPMRYKDALNAMLRFNWKHFWNQWTKYRIITLRNQLEHLFCLKTSKKARDSNADKELTNSIGLCFWLTGNMLLFVDILAFSN